MPVNVIDTIKPKNNGSFPVVEAADVAVSSDLRLPEALDAKANAADVAGKADKATTDSLQAQIDNLITPVTEDAEVQNARVGDDNTSYTTLKERLDSEYEKISDNIIESNYDVALWQSGSFNGADGSKQANANYLRTKDYLSSRVQKISVPEGWGLYCFAWENNTYIGAWRKSDNSFVTTGTSPQPFIDLHKLSKEHPTYKFKISATKGEAMTVGADADEIILNSISVAYADEVEEIRDNLTGYIDNAISDVDSSLSDVDSELSKSSPDVSLWHSGSYNVETGATQANAIYLRTTDFLNERVRTVSVPEGWGAYCFAWENDAYIGVWRKSDNAFIKASSSPQRIIDIYALSKEHPTYKFKVSVTKSAAMSVDADADKIVLKLLAIAYVDEAEAYTDDKVGELTDQFISRSAYRGLWENGLWNSQTGAAITSTSWIRNIDFLAHNVDYVKSTDYDMIIGAWENGTYIGAWRKTDNSFVKTGTSTNKEFDIKALRESFPTYEFKISVKTSEPPIVLNDAADDVIITLNEVVTLSETTAMVTAVSDAAKKAAPVPTAGQVVYSGDNKTEYNGYFIRNAVSLIDGTIIACRASGEVVRIGYSGEEETLLEISGTKMDWRCCWKDSNENVYVSPHGSWGGVEQAQRGLYRLENGSNTFTKVISLYDPSSDVPSETEENDDTIWTMCEDDDGNIYAGVYAHTVRANPKIYKSTDGGETFSVIADMLDYIPTGKHIHSIIFNKWNKGLYCIVGEYNSIFKSVDGGKTWTDLHITLDAKGSALCATKDGVFVGSDGTMLRIDWLHNDDKTHETVFKGWANTIFAIRQSDITGFLYAFTKIDSSVNQLFPPVEAIDDATALVQWNESVSAATVVNWTKNYNEIINTFPEDAIRPQHYGILISRDGGVTWDVLRYIKSDSLGADGYWCIGDFYNGEVLASAQVQRDLDGVITPTIKPPTIISEGKHRYVSGGCDLSGEIYSKTNTSPITEIW